MRKSISLVLVAVMLFAAIAVAIPTRAASAKNIDYVEAQYFTSDLRLTDTYPRQSGASIQ